MLSNLDKNISLLESTYLSTDDVLIRPATGLLSSRKQAMVDATFIYNSPMDTVASFNLFNQLLSTGQAAVGCRFNSIEARMYELALYKNKPNYWFTVGTSLKDFEMLQEYCGRHHNARLNISVDVAHGDTVQLHDLYRRYSTQPWCKALMSGTVATPKSAYSVFKSGCTHIRVGIGSGSACSTRIVTGCGVPNLSAVFQVWLMFADTFDSAPQIIADGGIRETGDIAKYLAAGANGVMIGNLLSRTTESAGWKRSIFYTLLYYLTLTKRFKLKRFYKSYRGQASEQFQLERRGAISGTPEGVQGPKQFPSYSYLALFNKIVNALRSTISYAGVKRITDLTPRNVELIRITSNGLQESRPHLLD